MRNTEMLSELLQQLDEINTGVKDCLYTLQENAKITRLVIEEIVTGAQEAPPLNIQDGILKDMIEEMNSAPGIILKDEMKVEELNIFDEDFEEKIQKKKEKITSKLKKTTIMGPAGFPIDVFELNMGEDMTREEMASELAKHMKNIQDSFNSKDDEDNDYDKSWT